MSFTAPGIASRPVEFLDIVYHISILRWFSELGLGSPTDRTYHYLLRAEQRYMAWWNMLKEIKPNPQNILIPPIASWRGDRSNNSAVRGVTLDPKTGDWDFEKAEEKLERMDALFQELETVPPDTWAVCEWIHITRDFTAAQNLLDVRHRYDQVFDLGIAQIESCYKDMAGPFSVNLWQLALTNFQVIRRILPNFWANSELTKR
ncbi:hypothetical protein H4R33_004814 [Dimargaris cristalligena]|nr:hypothetical protein H4R33_004814 [Dimargaris cristalligena]